MGYPVERNLDGVYFRMNRNGKYENVCFSDLTEEEQDDVMNGRNEKWLRSMCKILAGFLHDIGDEFNIKCQ